MIFYCLQLVSVLVLSHFRRIRTSFKCESQIVLIVSCLDVANWPQNQMKIFIGSAPRPTFLIDYLRSPQVP